MVNGNGKNGFRLDPKPNKAEQIRELQQAVTNTQAAVRVSQMLMQKIAENQKQIMQDFAAFSSMVTDVQYRLLAVQKLTGVNPEALDAEVATLRLQDFEEFSQSEDAAENLVPATTVTEQSTLILRSEAEPKDRSVFRLRVKATDPKLPQLKEVFLGKEVGARELVSFQGVDHMFELLGIREPAPAPATEPAPVPEPEAPAAVA